MNLSFGLSVALIGLLVVFSGLILLILFLKVFEIAFKERKQKTIPMIREEVPVPAVQAQPAPTALPTGVPADVIAAITAAIAAVWQEESGFIVRRVKRIHNASAWNRAGRDDQIYSRL